MRTYDLRASGGCLDPRLVNLLRREGAQEGVVVAPHAVRCAEQVLRFDAAEHPPLGTPVQVLLGRTLYCVTLADLAAGQQEHRAQVAAAEARAEAEHRRHAALAAAANSQLTLPVRWDTNYKRVLSGLTEHSNGNGSYRRTVEHIQLLEDLREGRLRRRAGDLLCASGRTGNGHYGELTDRDRPSRHGSGAVEYQPAVTCSACLRIAQRWRKE